MNNEQLLVEANRWTERAEEAIRQADFCHLQASRLLAHISVDATVERHFVLLQGGLSGEVPTNPAA